MSLTQNIPQSSFTNHLIHETSPYLLQHAHNPVDWHPWDNEALSRARNEDKPIFLSIGYSACHWCHVMERESFENVEIAAFLNEHFISVKVDREERPDLDDIYMAAVQMLTGNGGWPMSVFLTPDLEPFFGGTYFPAHDYYGTPGFLSVLKNVSSAWVKRRSDILENAASLTAAIRRHMSSRERASSPLTADLSIQAIKTLRETFDEHNGGFGGAPKFPPSGAIGLLLRKHHETHDKDLLKMATLTLDKMACGGMYDQLGGGFHRYSTDAQWLAPHFEKMLYDNALLAHLYLEAFQATGKLFYRRIATETLDYVLRDMQDDAGGFHSSEDADSEGQEGRFYLWTLDAIYSALGSDDGELACDYYGVNADGNFETHEPYHKGQSILHIESPATPNSEWDLDTWRTKLLAIRNMRVRPNCDDKVLTSWNALMISAFALGAQVTGDSRYGEAAKRAGHFLLTCQIRDGSLLRSFRKGESRLPGYLDDYACTAVALVDLYETTFDLHWIEAAVRLVDTMVAEFWDEDTGCFYATGSAHPNLIARAKPAYDGAEPSGNTMAATALLRLGRLVDNADYIHKAERVLEGYSEVMAQHPLAYLRMIAVSECVLRDSIEIAIIGAIDSVETKDLLRIIHSRFIPNKTVVAVDPASPSASDSVTHIPVLQGKTLATEKPAVYLCKAHTCQPPVTTPGQLEKLLQHA